MKEEIIEVPEKMYCKLGKNIEDVVELKRLLDNLLALRPILLELLDQQRKIMAARPTQ